MILSSHRTRVEVDHQTHVMASTNDRCDVSKDSRHDSPSSVVNVSIPKSQKFGSTSVISPQVEFETQNQGFCDDPHHKVDDPTFAGGNLSHDVEEQAEHLAANDPRLVQRNIATAKGPKTKGSLQAASAAPLIGSKLIDGQAVIPNDARDTAEQAKSKAVTSSKTRLSPPKELDGLAQTLSASRTENAVSVNQDPAPTASEPKKFSFVNASPKEPNISDELRLKYGKPCSLQVQDWMVEATELSSKLASLKPRVEDYREQYFGIMEEIYARR